VSIIGISGTRRAGAVFFRRCEDVGEIVELGELVDFVSGVLGSSSGSITSILVSGLRRLLYFTNVFSHFTYLSGLIIGSSSSFLSNIILDRFSGGSSE